MVHLLPTKKKSRTSNSSSSSNQAETLTPAAKASLRRRLPLILVGALMVTAFLGFISFSTSDARLNSMGIDEQRVVLSAVGVPRITIGTAAAGDNSREDLAALVEEQHAKIEELEWKLASLQDTPSPGVSTNRSTVFVSEEVELEREAQRGEITSEVDKILSQEAAPLPPNTLGAFIHLGKTGG